MWCTQYELTVGAPTIQPKCTPTESCISTAVLASFASSLVTALVMLIISSLIAVIVRFKKKAHSTKTRLEEYERVHNEIEMSTKSNDASQSADVTTDVCGVGPGAKTAKEQ